MHRRAPNYGESCRSLQRINSQHMRSAFPSPTSNNTLVAGVRDRHCSLTSPVKATISCDSFIKDGRKISVGDCALFKPPQDCPPFIGFIRWLRYNKENNLQLGVNWIYRPAELKLGKGTLVNSAPNEIFYSFHKDETPAASLLHPCKVAFLPKGAELPKGTSSFVCRRVYDITNKCLWWLTDQNFIDDRQEEVDQLLNKTRTEMHAALQPDGRSPKQSSGTTSISQLKSPSDSGQNNRTSTSHVKGRKRARVDQGSDSAKRERSLRSDGSEYAQCKIESTLKSEIAQITEHGGVTDSDGVEKLVQLMQSTDRMERKVDLVSRTMLAGVMSATDKVDCLNHFVQLGGLLVLDEWLQDFHRGKDGDGNDLKDSDKSREEFLSVLLSALDKLPVNLRALQMCNIGRSVNHLRSYKNSEIQRKARSLVDTWKKRVEAEMNISMNNIETKNGSTKGGIRNPSESDIAIKSSITPNSVSKTNSAKSSHVENITKSASSPGQVKPASSTTPFKESHPRTSVTDVPLAREDRSSSSNQSLSGKEDGKSSTACSATVNKISNNGSRNRKSSGFPLSVTEIRKETSPARISSSHRTTALEKLSPSAVSSRERVLEIPVAEGSSQKLIVKIPNRVCSPAQGIRDTSLVCSRTSSPAYADKCKPFENNNVKNMSDANSNVVSDVIIGSLQNNENKENGSAEGVVSPAAPGEERSMTTEDTRTSADAPQTKQCNSGKLIGSSFSPINALLEGCKFSDDANSSMSLEDDVGMKLLASVAAGEMTRSDMVSPTDSTERSTPAVSMVDDAKSVATPSSQFCNGAECDERKHALLDGCTRSENGLNLAKHELLERSGDRTCGLSHTSDGIPFGEGYKQSKSSNQCMKGDVDVNSEISDKSYEKRGSSILPMSLEKVRGCPSNEEIHEIATSNNGISNCKSGVMFAEGKTRINIPSSQNKLAAEVKNSSEDMLTEDSNGKDNSRKQTAAVIKDEVAEKDNNENLQPTAYCQESVLESSCEVKEQEALVKDSESCMKNICASVNNEVDKKSAGLCSTTIEAKLEDIESREHVSVTGRGVSGPVHNEPDACPAEASSSAAGASDIDSKVKFDLNEGCSDDEGNDGDTVNLASSGALNGYSANLSPFSLISIPNGHSPSITIASAAKGPFVPPDDLLRSKRELGWKGSAATSAFRPAEPRKVPETTSMPSPDASTSKHSRSPLDFDLNVPDEGILEEMASRECPSDTNSSVPLRSSSLLDFDLNRVDEANDNAHCSTSSNFNGESSISRKKSTASPRNCDMRRGFDLNNGPGLDDTSFQHIPPVNHQQMKEGSIPPSQLSSTGVLRMNNGPGTGMGNISSWFLPGNTYSTVAIPSMLPDRGEQQQHQRFPIYPQQRPFGPSGFTPDVYRAQMLSTSPAMPLQSSPYQFQVFPFGASFPLPSANFPTSYADTSSGTRLFAHPQLMNSAVSPQFQRQYKVDNTTSGGTSTWGGREGGLDLNSAMESEVREDLLPLPSGQYSLTSLQSIYSNPGGMNMKRKEPEGSWEHENNSRHKHSQWQ